MGSAPCDGSFQMLAPPERTDHEGHTLSASPPTSSSASWHGIDSRIFQVRSQETQTDGGMDALPGAHESQASCRCVCQVCKGAREATHPPHVAWGGIIHRASVPCRIPLVFSWPLN